MDIQCINVLYVKNKVTSVADGYKCHTVSRPAQKRGRGVDVIYKFDFKVENVPVFCQKYWKK